jgi:hypothetical protein
LPSFSILLMFMITTFYQTTKAVLVNPSQIIKDE